MLTVSYVKAMLLVSMMGLSSVAANRSDASPSDLDGSEPQRLQRRDAASLAALANTFSQISANNMSICRRGYEVARRDLHEEQILRARDRRGGGHRGGGHGGGRRGGGTVNRTEIHNNSNSNVHNNNNANLSGNSGVIIGAANMCKREVHELELERRDLDIGGSVLAALGGHLVSSSSGSLAKRSGTDDADGNVLQQMLVTRELGQMAQQLGVRALDHEPEQPFFRRNVGLACASPDAVDCSEHVKRDAEALLRMHARSLGVIIDL